jgi:MFS transporter, PAT family, solute carrier family 33 (acetyl-CoA transportor), member 1
MNANLDGLSQNMQVLYFPVGASSLGQHPGAFAALAVTGLITSFSSTLMFTALGSFFNRISDPAMGGAYLTLLNTIANMGESPRSDTSL